MILQSWLGTKGGTVVREVASHQCSPRSSPVVDAICGLSLFLVLSFAPWGFFPGTPVFTSLQKPTLPNSNSIWNARTRLNELLRTPLCSVCKQITILQGQYSRGAASLKPVNFIHVSFFFRKILSCLHCNLTSLLSFEGCCSQERETCSSWSRALGTNGEVKCQTSSAQRGLLLLYYILPVWLNPPCWSNIIHNVWPIIVGWYWIRLIGPMALSLAISKTVQQGPGSDGWNSVGWSWWIYRFIVVVVWCTGINSIYHYCTSVVSNKRLKTVNLTVLLLLLGCRQTSSSERWIWRHDQQKERTGTQHHDLWTKAWSSWKADRRTGWWERPLDGSCSCSGRKIWQDHWWRTFVLRRGGLFGSFHCGL